MVNLYRLAILFVLLISFGCSSTKPNMEMTSRHYNAPEGWDVSSVLIWNDREYTIKIIVKYKGEKPLRRIEFKPNFKGETWPQGYIHPNINSYSWESSKPEGEIPEPEDLSKQFHKSVKEIKNKMSTKEAQSILNTTSLSIKVFESDKSYDIVLN
ncbi:MAG: hypothetical protein ACOY30_03460 [Bacillota bacterium]